MRRVFILLTIFISFNLVAATHVPYVPTPWTRTPTPTITKTFTQTFTRTPTPSSSSVTAHVVSVAGTAINPSTSEGVSILNNAAVSINSKITKCDTSAVTVTGALPSGTNFIGYVLPYIEDFESKHYEFTAKQNSGTVVWTPGSGKRLVLMGYTISTKDYQTCWLTDGSGTTIVTEKYLSPRGGIDASSAYPKAALGVDSTLIFYSDETDCDHSIDLVGFER